MAKTGVKRLLVICQHYWPEDFRINDIVAGFIDSGIEVDVLCGIPNYPYGKFFDGYSFFRNRRQQKDGVNIYRTVEIPRGKSSFGILVNYLSYPFFASFSMLKLFGKKYDSILSYETSPVLMIFPAILFSKLKRLPLYSYVLDLWPENLYSVLPINNAFLRLVVKNVSNWHYRHGGKLMALSQGMKERLSQVTGKKDIEIFPQYCEDIYAECSKPKAQKSKRFNIMFAGNFSPAQGLGILIDIAKLCKQDNIYDVMFSMYGDGMSHKDIVDLTKLHGVEEYFNFFGRVSQSEIIEASGDADALFVSLVGTSLLDLTVPAKLSSCMAMCRPVLCSLSGAGAKVVETADCGYCSPPEDSQMLYNNLLQLKEQSLERLHYFSLNGKNYYKENLSRESVLPRLIKHVMES